MKRKPPRHYRDDEEPEREWVSTDDLKGCEYCGHEDHDRLTCPVRPPFRLGRTTALTPPGEAPTP